MEYATCPTNAHAAPDRCGARAQRIGRVKFVALAPEPEAAVATISRSPARLSRGVWAFLIRVFERLVAARPRA